MPDGFWRVPLQRNTFNEFQAVRRLPRLQEVVGSNPTEGTKIWFLNIYSIRVKCEELFGKTNYNFKKNYSIIYYNSC